MVLNFEGLRNIFFNPSKELNLGFTKPKEPKEIQGGQGISITEDEEGQDVVGLAGSGASIKYEYYDVVSAQGGSVYAQVRRGSSFTIGTVGTDEQHLLNNVRVKLYKVGSPTGNLIIAVYNTNPTDIPSGAQMASGAIAFTSITTDTNGAWYDINMGASATLSGATQYALTVYAPDADSSNYGVWMYKSPGGYAGGKSSASANSGATWTTGSADYNFEEWGIAN